MTRADRGLAPALAPAEPYVQTLDEGLSGPSRAHWLGQDKFGRDVLSRLIHGARLSLAVGIGTVGISLLVGLAAGSLAGFLGGAADRVFTGACDVLLAFPGILLAIGIAAVRGPSFGNVLFALSILGWVGYARVIRAQVPCACAPSGRSAGFNGSPASAWRSRCRLASSPLRLCGWLCSSASRSASMLWRKPENAPSSTCARLCSARP